MTTLIDEKETLMQLVLVSLNFNLSKACLYSEKEEVQIIIRHWIRILDIKLGWIDDFDKFVVNYVTLFFFYYLFIAITIFMLDIFCSLSKLRRTFVGHKGHVWSIDYSIFGGNQYLCSGSEDSTVRVWDVKTGKQVQLFKGHSSDVFSVKFSPYHNSYRVVNHCYPTICSSSNDKTIRFWDFKTAKEVQSLNGHTDSVCGIVFSPFSNGQYLCSGSFDKTIRLWDVKTFQPLHVFNGHKYHAWSVEFSPPKSNKNKNNNSIGVIGGNGYTICSGSWDKTIRLWDVETTKELAVFKGHKDSVMSVKYSQYDTNTICSGSRDNSVRLWDIRSNKEIHAFKEHINIVWAVEYSPFVSNDSAETSIINQNTICSGSRDNTIRFWDIRTNKQLHLIKGDFNKDYGIISLKFLALKKSNCIWSVNLCYGSYEGPIRIWE
ncbi:G-protein beta WD-40 repeats containing protein [Reticulomyxa filosa]|uniref:G-protein beta WD-40 repeats containing protein n=1 Tax=Reticulomyxa filosa TaxID=46433 RepID=X6NPI3_RETFI|nr:G-protein beta WD-40 repeats containing protein [Reticulomyxa filosa]|eukprot:ETO27896.1 G-protein beta WD-40 repeats containing protein [Reticulomyxa filosa]